jgi:flap endonuclease-1
VGLPFRDIVTAQELGWDALAGRTLAVDAYNAIYQFLATIRQADGRPFSDANGQVTSHLIGVFYRTTSLLSQGVRPVWVFDGKPPELKAGTLRARFQAKEKAEGEWREALAAGDLETARRKAAQTSHLTRPMAEEAGRLLNALGVPTVQAPSEGEAQASLMAARGQVWAAASEDYDSLLFGAPRLVRGLAARARAGKAPGAQVIDRDALLAQLGVTGDELILIGIIVGTDFNEGARGYGPKKALKIVREHLGWEATLARVGIDRAEAEVVADLFRHPEVADVPTPAPLPLEADEVEHLLVDGHGFQEDRVRAAVARAARRPKGPTPTVELKGRQSLLDAFGGPPA